MRSFGDIVFSLDQCMYCITNNFFLWTAVFGDIRIDSQGIPSVATKELQGVAAVSRLDTMAALRQLRRLWATRTRGHG